MNDHRSTTRRRGHYRRRTRRQSTGLTAMEAQAKGLPAERAEVGTAAAIARDGGYPDSLVLNPESLISRDDDGIRRGPYEGSYVISRGYEG